MKIRPVGAELFHEDGQTDMIEANSRFSELCEAPPPPTKKTEDARRSSTQDVRLQSKKLCAAVSSTASHRA